MASITSALSFSPHIFLFSLFPPNHSLIRLKARSILEDDPPFPSLHIHTHNRRPLPRTLRTLLSPTILYIPPLHSPLRGVLTKQKKIKYARFPVSVFVLHGKFISWSPCNNAVGTHRWPFLPHIFSFFWCLHFCGSMWISRINARIKKNIEKIAHKAFPVFFRTEERSKKSRERGGCGKQGQWDHFRNRETPEGFPFLFCSLSFQDWCTQVGKQGLFQKKDAVHIVGNRTLGRRMPYQKWNTVGGGGESIFFLFWKWEVQ